SPARPGTRGTRPSPCRVRTCAGCGCADYGWCFSWSLPGWCSWLWQCFELEVVVPLVEIQVAAVPLDLASLQVDGLGSEVRLCRHQRPAIVVVERDAVAVQAAEVEACDGWVAGVEPAEGHVHRHPAVRGDVQLPPVVQVPVRARREHHPRLPARGDAVEPQ